MRFQVGDRVRIVPDLGNRNKYSRTDGPGINYEMLSMAGNTYEIILITQNTYRQPFYFLRVDRPDQGWKWIEKWLEPADPDLL